MAGPDFLGIGAQKAGTTWLHDQFVDHPDIWVPPCKEIHYFDREARYPSLNTLATTSPWRRLVGKSEWEGPRCREGIREMVADFRRGDFRQLVWNWRWYFGNYDDLWYVKLFPPRKGDLLRGEITPEYSILERDDVARIHAINPEMKLIFLLRNPVERSWSSVRYNVQRGSVHVQFDLLESLVTELSSFRLTRRCDYLLTLRLYLEFFPPSQILLGFYDAVSEAPSELMAGIFDFLGVDKRRADTRRRNAVVNKSPKREMPEEIRRFLNDMYRPAVLELSEIVGGGYPDCWLQTMGTDAVKAGASPRKATIQLSECAIKGRLTP